MRQPKLEARLKPLRWKIGKGRTDYIKCEIIHPGLVNPLNSIREVIWMINDKPISNYRNVKALRNELLVENASPDLNNGVLKCRLVDVNNGVAETQTFIQIVDENESASTGAEKKSPLKITSNR